MKYSEVAEQYKKISKNQASAGEKLISLIDFKGNESILDLGCGTGHLTLELSKRTHGIVIGIDSSEGMIQRAKESCGNSIEFICQSGEEMNFISKFDVVFCNSVFHWFKKPKFILEKIKTALTDSGIFALQTPLKEWCTFITDSINQTCQDSSIKRYIDHYTNPWFHLENAEEYREDRKSVV
jgi:trans-aconitate 2-methyltransferase